MTRFLASSSLYIPLSIALFSFFSQFNASPRCEHSEFGINSTTRPAMRGGAAVLSDQIR